MNIKKLVQVTICLTACSFCGCQSWMGGYPLQSPSRVPPPGTGTYQVPSSYYNNTGGNVSTLYQGVPAQGGIVTNQGIPAAAPNAIQPATFTTPANNGSFGANGNANGSVLPATTNPQAYSQGSPGASVSFRDDSQPPALDWQP